MTPSPSRLALTAALAVIAGAPSLAVARDYYFSPKGSDTESGADPEHALQTLAKLAELQLKPGDRALLEGGARFSGTVLISAEDSGDATKPVTIASWGKGPATIAPRKGDDGILVRDARYVLIQELRIQAARRLRGRSFGNGVHVVSSGAGKPPASLVFRDLDASGFGGTGAKDRFMGIGILVEALPGASGTSDIRFEHVRSHDNDLTGFEIVSHSGKRHHRIEIIDSEAYRNDGLRGLPNHTGSGILIGQTSQARVEGSRAWENGKNNEANGGPVGIWAWDSDHVVFRSNVSFRNHTASHSDGAGFDFDGGVTDSLMENNDSYENDGAGYLLSSYPGSEPVQRNVIRGNRSRDDGRKNGYANASVFGEVSDCVFEENTFTMHAAPEPPSVLGMNFWTGKNVVFQNNRFRLERGLELLSLTESARPRLTRNDVTYLP